MEKRKNNTLRKFIFAALCLALALLLPRLTGGNPQLGMALSPMHIPALLCGFVCGWPYALLCGALSPILNSVLFGMPPMFPVAVAMMFELAVYGLIAGILYKLFPKKTAYIYVTLIIAMIVGRIVGVAATCIFTGAASVWPVAASYFVNTLLGVAVQIAIIPLIVIALKKAGYILND